jgi:WD40 repeat protein
MRFITTRVRVVDQVAFAHDGRQLFVAGSNVPDLRYKPDNRGIEVWDLTGGPNPTTRLLAEHLIAGFAINPAGRWLYVGTGFDYPDESTAGYSAVDLASGAADGMGLSFGNAFVLGVHPTGGWLVGFGQRTDWQSRRLVRWRQPPTAAPVEEWETRPRAGGFYTHQVACDPSGTRVITHEIEGGIAVRDQVYELVIRDPGTGEKRGTVPIPGRTVGQLLFSPDGSWLVIRGGPSLLIWDARDLARKPRKIRGEGKGHFTGLAFHPAGRYLAAASNDRTVVLYDTDTWQLARVFTWDVGRMRSVAFSPEGLVAAAGSDTGKVVIWDIDV